MLEIKIASIDSFIIYFSSTISQESAKKVKFAYESIKGAKLSYIKDLVPSYTSLLVRFNALHVSFEEAKEKILTLLKEQNSTKNDSLSRQITIPVLYDTVVGLDLENVAKFHNLSIQEVIEIHSSKEYLVYAIGFLPGFAYMGEVDERIVTPRLANPRAKLPKGSVGIADNQTATYPKESPGGWRILGRTPINMFDLSYDGFSYLHVGDKVSYKPISKDEFLELGGIYG